jgi:hypothetical protein
MGNRILPGAFQSFAEKILVELRFVTARSKLRSSFSAPGSTRTFWLVDQ